MNTEESTELARPTGLRGRDLIRTWIGPAVLVIIGAAGLVGSFQLGIGNTSQPGPGMWPAVASAVVLVGGLLTGPQPDTENLALVEARRVASALVLVALFVVLFTYTGIFIPTLIVLTLWLKFLAQLSWLRSLIIGAATAGVFYALFTLLFGVGL